MTVFRTHPIEGVIFILRNAISQGAVIGIFFFISSCADYKPVIDFRGSEKKGADLERYDDDLSSCKKLAEQTVPNAEHNIEKVLILPQETERALII